EPRQPALDFLRIGCPARRCGDAFGPAGGVLVLLIRQPHQDGFAFGIRFAVREMLVGGRRLDLAAPHLLDRGEVGSVERHQPITLSKNTMVPIPAAISSTWRSALASIS